VKNSIKLFGLILLATLLIYGCSKDETPDDQNKNQTVLTPIYFFQSYNLRSLNLDNQGGASFKTESTNQLTEEIYSIAYDPSDGTFFGMTDYYDFSYSGIYFESYNPTTKVRIKKKICNDSDYHSVSVNTKTNKKILIKYSGSYEKVIFQEVSSQGVITFNAPEIDLGGQVSSFIYIESLNAFVAKKDNYSDLKISVVNANTYALETVTIDIDYPSDPIGTGFNYSDLNYDKKNDILYYLRSNGLYVIDLKSKKATLINTNWIEFFQSKFGQSEELNNPMTIYYPPTNELIIQGNGFFGSTYGNSKFFAIDLTTKQAREIKTSYHTLDRVYGFALKN
jgi:hypothetical protein